jgi:Xaa-Pro aminopeptidase
LKRLLIVFLLFVTAAFAIERQPNADYRARREALAQKAKNGIILVFAGTEASSGDAIYGFRQDDNFYYLSGLTIPGAALLIAPAVDEKSLPPEAQQQPPEMRPKPRPYAEVLLLPRHSPQERWTGKRLGPGDPGVEQQTGFDRVAPLDALAEEVARLSSPAGAMLWVNEGEDSKAPVDWLKRTGSVFARDARPLLASLRVAKDAGEMERIRKATQASMAAHRAAMKMMKPGLNEHDVESVMVYEFMKNGCERPAYAPIVGAGFNSTVLHYSADDGPIKAGDTVVMDVAGEYSMYASDITRTLPATGHFTPRQREIYEVVLGAQQAAIDAFQAGKSVLIGRDNPDSLFKVAYDYINTHGKDSKGQPLGQYLIHGIGHNVGLNVHDPADGNKPIQPGAVFTLEPGVYIPDENLGIRVEDIFWVAPDGKLVRLTEGLPRTPDEVEKAMAGKQ